MSEAATELSTKYDGIIPTGWLTAYGRTFSNIRYAQEMFDQLEAICKANDSTEILEVMKDANLAPQFEARHKLLDQLLRQTGIKQVVEVAAGLSTRGLEITDDNSYEYVELDLPSMIAAKKRIVASLQKERIIPKRQNLHFEAGSAVELGDVLRATRRFDQDKPIVIVNEGLLRYLNFGDKGKYADNVRKLLKKFGGVWITSDISLPKVVYKEKDIMPERRKKISEITGVNVDDNLFKGEKDAKQFFERLGFDVESHSFMKVIDDLTSPAKLGMPRDYVEAINASPVCFVMHLRA